MADKSSKPSGGFIFHPGYFYGRGVPSSNTGGTPGKPMIKPVNIKVPKLPPLPKMVPNVQYSLGSTGPSRPKAGTLLSYCVNTNLLAKDLLNRKVKLGEEELLIVEARDENCPWANTTSTLPRKCTTCVRLSTATTIHVVLGTVGTQLPIIRMDCCEYSAKDFHLIPLDMSSAPAKANMTLVEIMEANKTRKTCIQCGSKLREECWFVDTHMVCDKCEKS